MSEKLHQTSDSKWTPPPKPRTRTYEYTTFGDDERYEFHSNFVPESKEWVAEDAAEDFFNNHDGWECTWPVALTVYSGDECLGSFSVDMETVPRFSAIKLMTT
jgi:hypothetical protein